MAAHEIESTHATARPEPLQNRRPPHDVTHEQRGRRPPAAGRDALYLSAAGASAVCPLTPNLFPFHNCRPCWQARHRGRARSGERGVASEEQRARSGKRESKLRRACRARAGRGVSWSEASRGREANRDGVACTESASLRERVCERWRASEARRACAADVQMSVGPEREPSQSVNRRVRVCACVLSASVTEMSNASSTATDVCV